MELLDFTLWKSEMFACSNNYNPDERLRIIRCKAQTERFDFFFAFYLGGRLYSHTDNLSKDLQGTKMAATSGKRLAKLTEEALTISMLMLPTRVKVCLANQRFQEYDALRPDWRVVQAHQAICCPLWQLLFFSTAVRQNQ